MHGVAAQQARALLEVVLAALAHDDGAQPQAEAAAGVADEDAGEEPPDAAEAVEHDIGRLVLRPRLERRDLLAGVLLEAGLGGVDQDAAEVERDAAHAELVDDAQDGHGVLDAKHALAHPPCPLVGLQDLDRRLVDELLPVHVRDDVALPVQAAEDRHGELCEGETVEPGLVGVVDGKRFCGGHVFTIGKRMREVRPTGPSRCEQRDRGESSTELSVAADQET